MNFFGQNFEKTHTKTCGSILGSKIHLKITPQKNVYEYLPQKMTSEERLKSKKKNLSTRADLPNEIQNASQHKVQCINCAVARFITSLK